MQIRAMVIDDSAIMRKMAMKNLSASELANIAAGITKTKMDQRGIKANLSLPAVVRGEQMKALHMRNLPSAMQYLAFLCGMVWNQLVVGTNVVPTKESGK